MWRAALWLKKKQKKSLFLLIFSLNLLSLLFQSLAHTEKYDVAGLAEATVNFQQSIIHAILITD